MTRKKAFFLFALTSVFFFLLLFTIWTIVYNHRIKGSLRQEVISQAFIIRDALRIAQAKNPQEDLQNLITEISKEDLKITLTRTPVSKITSGIKRFDGRRWAVATIPVTLRNFSGQLEVARPVLFKGPSYIACLFIFSIISIVCAFLLFSLTAKSINEFLFSFRGDKEAWQKFISSPAEIGEIARIALEKEGKKEEMIGRLKEKEQNLSFLVSLMKDPGFIVDENRRFLFANSSFLKLCAVDESSLLSRASLSLFMKNPQVEKFINLVIAKGEVSDFEIELSGEFYLATGKVFPSETKGMRIVGVLAQITERKREEKRRRDFMARVASEVQIPLAAIKGAVETLRARVRGKNRQFLSLIDSHTGRLANLASHLLTPSHLGTSLGLNVGDVSLKKTLKESLSLFSHAIRRKGLKARLILPKSEVIVRGDPYLLGQAFSNLLDNAVKSTLKGTKGKIEIELAEGLDYAEVSFKIPREDLVDKFQKAEESGIGLSILKYVLHLHKGKVDVRSEAGKGTTFIVFLPKAFNP